MQCAGRPLQQRLGGIGRDCGRRFRSAPGFLVRRAQLVRTPHRNAPTVSTTAQGDRRGGYRSGTTLASAGVGTGTRGVSGGDTGFPSVSSSVPGVTALRIRAQRAWHLAGEMLPHPGPPGQAWARLARVAPQTWTPPESVSVGPPIISVGGQVPWQAAMEPRLRALLGNGVDADVAIRLLSRGAPNTVKQYANMWHMFEEWCVREGHQCLPASTATCVLYAGHIAGRGTVRASSMQPYFSAINRVHRDCLGIEEGPASGGLLIRLRQGLAWEQAQTPANPRDTRVALPADVAYLAVVAGLSMAEPHSREQAAELRAVIAVVLGFLCMGRADTIVHISIRDVVWDASQIIFVLEHEKGRSLRADYRARTLTFCIDPSRQPLLLLLQKWNLCRATWGHATMFFALNGEILPKSPHAPMTQWLTHVCHLLCEQPPQGYAWSSHSLRKGGASAASAIGVPLPVIRHIGGWATTSAVVMKYIDPSVMASTGAWFFFGNLTPISPPPTLHFSF